MGPMQPNLDVILGNGETLRSFRGAHLFYISHHHYGPIVLRQTLNGLFQESTHLAGAVSDSGFDFVCAAPILLCLLSFISSHSSNRFPLRARASASWTAMRVSQVEDLERPAN